jgi:UPF0755 protein
MENMENQNQEIKPEKKEINRSRLFILGGVAIFLIILAVFLFYVWLQIYQPICWRSCKNEVPQDIKIESGIGVKGISLLLESSGLIRSRFWFESYVWLKKQGTNMQAGNYQISKLQNVPQIVEAITGGKVVSDEVQITFPEGFTLFQIRERLIAQGFSVAENLDKEKIAGYKVQYKFFNGAPEEASLEGFLFPDTYRFKNDATIKEIVKKFLDNFDKKLLPEWREAIASQDKTVYEIINLASIVQQEAIGEQDMSLIAGVFAGRLKIGMALQSDATVNYATGKKLRQPTLEDIKVSSPYNTYLIKGLPPTPIANPGAAAILAVINPTATDYLYFLHPLDGATVFSKTLEEHNRNKAKYLK